MQEQSQDEQDLDDTVSAIKAAFAASLPDRLKDIGDALQACLDAPGQERYDALLFKLHGLSGSAGTFGFANLGFHATELEIWLGGFIKEGEASGRDFAAIAGGVQEMLRRASSARRASAQAVTPVPRRADPSLDRLIYLVHDNGLVAADMAAQLRYFGYEVQVVESLSLLQQCIDARTPAAVVMDLGFPAGILAGSAEVARIKQSNANRFAVIFISTRSNFQARLATVRAGADGYFSKPLDMVALIDRLDTLLQREATQPFRILIIDDDIEVADFHATILRDAGMEVRVLYKVGEMLQVLGEYRPELILMDVYMPDCSGVDLSRLIRQDNMYLDVPIVFLSGESDMEKQLNAIESGADDFLTKPIKPAHLVSAVSSRAQRYRALRSLIMRDSLTGLFNHSAIKEYLLREVARARRSAAPLVLAMVDIDHFKQINDSYGHPVGDQVIRALSRLLSQRLRRGDIIGRYGGEEFAVIMPATPGASAENVMDQIRQAFANIRHHAERQDFTATFSAGVVELHDDLDADALLRIADAALYRAKHEGRNRVVLD